MKSAISLGFAALLLSLSYAPAEAAPTPEQQQEISDCGIMAQAVQLFAEARDKGLSKMDAFKSVTQGRAVYKPGSRVDETLQWAYAHPDEKPEAATAHFSGRCTLNALDILNPLSEEELRLAVQACQKENAATPEGIKPCIIDKTSSIIVASNTPPAPPVPTELEAPATATVAVAPEATVAVPSASVAAVPQPPAPIVLPPTEVTVPAPETAPAPVVQGTGRVAVAPTPSVALSAVVVKQAPAPAPVVVAQAPTVVTPPPAVAPAPQPAPEPVAPAPVIAVASSAPAPAPVVAVAPRVTSPTPVTVRAAPAPVTAVVVATPARPAPAVVAAAPVSPSSATIAGTRPPSFDTILKVSLGMPIHDARKSFGTSVQDVETDADGNTDYTYMISDDHGFVDVFTSPENPDQVAGVSINGGADVEMQPIMGIRLGDGAFELLTRVGPPDRKVPVPGTERTRWIYGDRNYAFDVSNGGDIIGIRIYGSLGLPETAAAATSASNQ